MCLDNEVYWKVCEAFDTICDDLKVTWRIDTFSRYDYSKFTITSGLAKGKENISVSVYWNCGLSVYDFLDTLKYYLLECLDERKENYDWSVIMKYFTKKDLKNGDVVVFRNGDVGIAIPDQNVIVTENGYRTLSDRTDDLRFVESEYPECDIMKIYRPYQPHQCRFHPCGYSAGTLVYERKEIEEMTLEEVCKALGKEIKIVKEK